MGSRSGPTTVDRYAVFGEIASGGMATVHFGRLLGPAGFGRLVAIKRLHAHLAKDPEFVGMLLDEARLAARLHHPNVVATLDVVSAQREVFLVMEYVSGASLALLLKRAVARGERIDARIIVSILSGVLQGLHAAHDACDDSGRALGIVHRDVSPQNILVGADGVARVLDFGIAKAAGRIQTTREGQIKGKLSYMAPEQLHGGAVDRRTDVYAASIVLWESLTCERLFSGANDAAIFTKLMQLDPDPPSQRVPSLDPAFDAVVLRGLHRDASRRFPSARDMALALEGCARPATAFEVAAWVEQLAGDVIAKRVEESTRTVAPVRLAEKDAVTVISAQHARPRGLGAHGPRDSAASTSAILLGHRGRPAMHRRAAGLFGAAVGVLAACAVIVSIARTSPGPTSSVEGAPAPSMAPVTPVPIPSPPPPVADLDSGAAPTRASAVGSIAVNGRAEATGNAQGQRLAGAPSTARADANSIIDASIAPAPEKPRTHGATSARAGCALPYSIDEHGFRVYKVECL